MKKIIIWVYIKHAFDLSWKYLLVQKGVVILLSCRPNFVDPLPVLNGAPLEYLWQA